MKTKKMLYIGHCPIIPIKSWDFRFRLPQESIEISCSNHWKDHSAAFVVSWMDLGIHSCQSPARLSRKDRQLTEVQVWAVQRLAVPRLGSRARGAMGAK